MTINLATWNINLGLKFDTVLKQIQSEESFAHLDLLFLQEVSQSDTQKVVTKLQQKGSLPYLSLQSTAQNIKKRDQGNAIIWNQAKFKLNTAWTLPLPNYRQTSHTGRETTLLKRVAPQKRIALMCELKYQEYSLRLYSLHLDVLGWQHKVDQLARVLDLDSHLAPVDLTLIAGDFNTISNRFLPPHTAMHSLIKTHGFMELTTDIKYTFTAARNRSKQKLDFIFIKTKLKYTSQSEAIETNASDHLPVFSTIKFASAHRQQKNKS